LRAKEAPAVTTERIEWSESGVLSAKRQYLRISYGRYSFDLCAAPFGHDYFFSWWLVQRQPDLALMYGCGTLIALPVLLSICLQIAGFFNGILLFLVLASAGFYWILNAARSGMGGVEDTILAIPVLGPLYNRFFKPVTYYAVDTRKIFEDSVHRIVLQHVEALRTVSKLPPLAPEQTKPESRIPTL
jgi:hypothetical protein